MCVCVCARVLSWLYVGCSATKGSRSLINAVLPQVSVRVANAKV